MAGVTNTAFRTLCRRYGAGLYVSEMISARALVEGTRKTLRMVTFAADETPRSVQLSGVDPGVVAAAIRVLVDDVGVDDAAARDLDVGALAQGLDGSEPPGRQVVEQDHRIAAR